MTVPSPIIVCSHCQSLNRIPGIRLGDNPRCGKCKQPLFTGRPISLTDQTFDRHLTRSDLPMVVDFWAEWCAPCKMMAPFFEQAASELEPYAQLVKVNTDENPRISWFEARMFEFKVVELAPEGRALQQIKDRGYADKYRADGCPIHLIGVEFSRERRTLVGFEVESSAAGPVPP